MRFRPDYSGVWASYSPLFPVNSWQDGDIPPCFKRVRAISPKGWTFRTILIVGEEYHCSRRNMQDPRGNTGIRTLISGLFSPKRAESVELTVLNLPEPTVKQGITHLFVTFCSFLVFLPVLHLLSRNLPFRPVLP